LQAQIQLYVYPAQNTDGDLYKNKTMKVVLENNRSLFLAVILKTCSTAGQNVGLHDDISDRMVRAFIWAGL